MNAVVVPFQQDTTKIQNESLEFRCHCASIVHKKPRCVLKLP
jgi:hypothetical protein